MKISRGDSLDRYYLLKLFGFGVFLHRIHHSDPPGLFHNHPWSGLSVIFGHYHEFTRDTQVTRRWFNWIKATRHHRVELCHRPVWTLFIHGRKSNKWSIVDTAGNKVETPWEGAEGHKSYTKAIEA